MQIEFGQDTAKYRGNRTKVAVVKMNGREIILGLSDTARCANSVETAERTLKNLAQAQGIDDWKPNGEPAALHSHCRELLGLEA